MRSFGRSTIKLLLAGGFAAAVIASTSAYGGLGGNVSPKVQAALDAAFAAASRAPDRQAATPDLDDGRSRVGGRWRAAFEAFARADHEHPPAPGGVVVVGSSSISLWGGMESQFGGAAIVRRGLGGARMADVARHADRLILPYLPKTVVVYAGDNDLAENVSPELVVAAYADLARQVHRVLPEARIAFVSIKPSPARAALMPVIARTNDLVAALSADDPRFDYIDVYSRMVDADGRVRPELFAADELHLNRAGYAVWREAIASHIP